MRAPTRLDRRTDRGPSRQRSEAVIGPLAAKRSLVVVGGTAAANRTQRAAGHVDESTPTLAPAPGLTRRIPAGEQPHAAYDAGKRLIDIVGALVILVITLPLLVGGLVLVAASSGRPLFFGQRRIGIDGAAFTCWKFRTMAPDAESRVHEVAALDCSGAPTAKHPDDPRVTAVGRYLRKLTIDELPQLWNVLRGEMSLVGPRPLVLAEVVDRLHPMERLSVKPGLTCMWQLAGRSDIDFAQRMLMDLDYVRRRSLWFDLVLVVKTPFAIFSRRGAY